MGGDANAVLVTGHAGFVGRSLTRLLDAEQRPWVGLSRGSGYDLTRRDTLDTVPDSRWVVHLAGVSGVRESWKAPALFHRINLATTLGALELARERGAAFVFVSSYMYGVPHRLPVDELHPPAWNNPYAASKYVAETLVRTYADNFGLPVTIIRPFNLFGPSQSTEFLVPYVVHQALTGDSIVVDDLSPRRDYLWVGDLGRALKLVLDARDRPSGLYNVGRGESHSVVEVIDAVQEVLGPRIVRCREDARPNEIPDCVCDHSRFSAAFGWQPQVSLREGIRRMTEPDQQRLSG